MFLNIPTMHVDHAESEQPGVKSTPHSADVAPSSGGIWTLITVSVCHRYALERATTSPLLRAGFPTPRLSSRSPASG